MPTVLQHRRGTTSQNNSFTGAIGEITIELKVDPLNLAGQKTVLQTVNNWNGERCVSGDSAVTVAGIRTLHHCHLIKTTPKSSKIK